LVTIESVQTPQIVIDTNVFVSALRSRRGASYRLLGLIGTGRFEVELSVPLALEYESVGRRILPATNLTEADLDAILDFVYRSARLREIFYSWRPCLVDPADDMVLELAVAAGGATIVTFNRRDFRGAEQFGVRVCSPQEFLSEIGEGQI
jgi:predicted nucleic acid-binding protein